MVPRGCLLLSLEPSRLRKILIGELRHTYVSPGSGMVIFGGPTGRAISARILLIRIKDLLNHLTALDASCGVLYPTKPIWRSGKYFTSVIGNFAKCFRTSSSVNLGGRPLT